VREEETKSWQMWSAGSTWNGLRIMLWVLLGALFSLALFLKQQEWLAYIASGADIFVQGSSPCAALMGAAVSFPAADSADRRPRTSATAEKA